MNHPLSVQFGPPAHGWIQIAVSTDDQAYEANVSAVPDDSISRLVSALSLVARHGEMVVTFSLEPEHAEWFFFAAGKDATLSITTYADHRRTQAERPTEFEATLDRQLMCLAFWRALRRLESSMPVSQFETEWGHPFPSEQVAKLGELAKRIERES